MTDKGGLQEITPHHEAIMEHRPENVLAVHNETFDVADEATGRELPKHYYRSWQFIGTVAVCPSEPPSTENHILCTDMQGVSCCLGLLFCIQQL